MPGTVCQTCLRCDILVVKDIDVTLARFYLELCQNNIDEIYALKFCSICEYQLRKFYNFRQKCRRSSKVLNTWRLSNDQESLDNLYKMIPPPSITFQYKDAAHKIMEFTHTDIEPLDIIKLEKEDSESKTDNIVINNESKLYENISHELNYEQEKKGTEVSLKLEDENQFYEVDMFNDDDDADYEPERKKSKSKTAKSSKTRKKKTDRRTRSSVKYLEDVNVVLKDSEKITAKRKQFSKNQSKLKDRILTLLEAGEFQDLGVTMNEDVFLKMFEKCEKSGLRSMLPLKPGSAEERQRLKKFLLHLLKKNNPEYEDIFQVELLDTEDKKLDEFNRRKLSKEYMDAEFKCERCYKVFEVQRLLDYHNRWHEARSGAHECEICAMRFASRKALAQHRKTNHCAVYRCKLCPMLTYNSAVMVNHYNQHKGMEYSCPICLSVFSNKNTLNNHRRQAHQTSHICALCARSFVSEKGLYFHKRLKHKDEEAAGSGVSCDKCSAVLTSPAVLRAHARRVHAGTHTIHKCFHCKDIFHSLEELKKHKVEMDHQRPPKPRVKQPDDGDKSSPAEEKPTCAECARTFNSRKSYLRHVNVNHKPNRIHKCGFCGAKFSLASELESHRAALSHHRKVRYQRKAPRPAPAQPRLHCNDPHHPTNKCLLCEEAVPAARTNSMYQHFQSAHPDTPYASVYAQPHNRHLCHQCGKTFKDLTFFLDHANLHSGAKPYACGTCARAYSTRRHLRLHAARHAPPRHQCRDCGKLFASAANLFAHRRGHIGDRRFKCEICAKGFLHQAALNEHIRGVHHHIRRARKATAKI